MNQKNKDSIDHRKDNRTLDQFKSDIKSNTKKEKIAAYLIKKDLELKGNQVKSKDYGIDNTGELITDHKKVSARPDYLFKINEKQYIFEIKVHSLKRDGTSWPFMTFKACDLKHYIKLNAHVVIVEKDHYTILDAKVLKYILNNIEGKIYPNFSPNDISHRVYKDKLKSLKNSEEYNKFIKIVYWHEDLCHDLNKHKEIFKCRK